MPRGGTKESFMCVLTLHLETPRDNCTSCGGRQAVLQQLVTTRARKVLRMAPSILFGTPGWWAVGQSEETQVRTSWVFYKYE